MGQMEDILKKKSSIKERMPCIGEIHYLDAKSIKFYIYICQRY